MNEAGAIESLVPGSRLDRYELLCPLAKGGMASVWIARQIGKHGFEKLVVIKTILPQFSSDHRFQRMFLDEAHIAAGIEHTNVTQILDLGEQHDVLYIAMEYVDGDALSKLQRVVEKKDLAIPTGIILRMLADACAGLHAAHELRGRDGELLGVVHRDVSPQNVLVSVKGVSKIIDFGVAKARDRVADDTNAGVLKGKIQFMAPEQAMGKTLDRRADVWAIGAMLYSLLSGKPPFDGPNQLAILHKLTSGRPPLPLPPSVPKPISDIVRAVLVQDPKTRVSTAAELQNRLEDAMVATNLRATHADVAAFMREHMSERAAARRKAIDVALAAAAERARVAQVLAVPPNDSASGVLGISSAKGVAAPSSAPSIPSIEELVPSRSEPPTAAGIPSALAAERPISGSGVLEPVATPPSPAKSNRVVLGAVAALVVLVIAIVGVTASKKSPPPAPAAAPTPQPTIVASASSPIAAPSPSPVVSAPAATATASVAAATTVTTTAPVTTAAAKSTKAAPTTTGPKPKSSKPVDDGF